MLSQLKIQPREDQTVAATALADQSLKWHDERVNQWPEYAALMTVTSMVKSQTQVAATALADGYASSMLKGQPVAGLYCPR
jgi:hypothetical protein